MRMTHLVLLAAGAATVPTIVLGQPTGSPQLDDSSERSPAETMIKTPEKSAAAGAMVPGSQIMPEEGADVAVGAGARRKIPLTVRNLDDYVVVGAQGNRLGEVEGVALVGGRLFAVVESGGFFGLGEERAAIALSALLVDDQETLVAADISEERLQGISDFQLDQHAMLPFDQTVMLGAL